MEHEFQNQCPYCGEMIWMEFYPEEGRSQETIIDCEVCCNPILYRVRFDRMVPLMCGQRKHRNRTSQNFLHGFHTSARTLAPSDFPTKEF